VKLAAESLVNVAIAAGAAVISCEDETQFSNIFRTKEIFII
jgi:hypothetical protein